MALCTSADVESIVQINYNTALQTDITNTFIPYVESAIKRFLGYDPELNTSSVERFDGKERRHLFLKVTAVNSVAAMVEHGITLTEGNENDYVVVKEEGYIVKTGHSRWSDDKYQKVVVN